MQAFVAIMLIAAVSGQMTTGVDKNIMDYLRFRNTVYPQQQQQYQGQQYIQGQYQRGFPTTTTNTAALYNYIQKLQQQQQNVNGINVNTIGDLMTNTIGQQIVPTTFVQPSTQQVNVNSDFFIYSLRQLYTLPLFQEYLNLPLFREFFYQVPAFQKYIVSPAFQKYWTQAEFKQFFVNTGLFYKYIFPIVIQYQQQQYQYPQQYQQGVTIPEVFRGQQTTMDNIYGQQYNVLPTMYNNMYNNNNKQAMYNFDLIKTLYPEVYGVFGKNMMYNNNFVNKNVYNKNILDLLTGKTQEMMYPIGVMGQRVQTPFIPTTTTTNTNTINNNIVDQTAEMYLEKIFKDLLTGKVDITDLKDNTNFNTLLNEQINKIVDPITGEVKIVEEKIVKPFQTVMTEGEQTNQDTLVKKILLNKAIFNKL